MSSATLSIFLLFFGTSVYAQTPTLNPDSLRPVADTGTADEGSRAGRIAAGQPEIAGRAALGFVGGLPIGFLGLLILQGDPAGAIGLGSGLAIIGAAATLGNANPQLNPSMADRGKAYRRAYTDSYKDRLLERRGKAAILGGVAGTITGFGLLYSLLSQITT